MSSAFGPYLKAVESHFLAAMGQGHSLNAVDVARVMKWHQEAVPLRLLLGLIDDLERRRRQEGSDARGARMTLGGIQRSLDAALRQRAERLGPPQAEVERSETADSGRNLLQLAMEKAGHHLVAQQVDARLLTLWRQGFRELKELLQQQGDLWDWATQFDERVSEVLPQVLEAEALARLDAELFERERLKLERMSAGARVERLGVLRAQALRTRYQVPELMPLLLAPPHEVP